MPVARSDPEDLTLENSAHTSCGELRLNFNSDPYFSFGFNSEIKMRCFANCKLSCMVTIFKK